MPLMSVVIPSYNEDESIIITANKIDTLLSEAKIQHELIFVDDGSKDNTWDKILELSLTHSTVRGIRFSRNFGKEAAIMAGLSQANGDCCVVIDCDLQHPPETIIEMYNLWQQGYEIIEGKKSDRGKEGILHKFAAKYFYRIISLATGIDMSNTSDFKLLDRKAVNVIINMRERNAFFRAMSTWIGFKTNTVYFEVQDRIAGSSKWSVLSLIKYALRNISCYSTIPMQLVTVIGCIIFIISLILTIMMLIGINLGQNITIIIIQLFSSSILLIGMGIIGYYIARIFEEVKDRPRYIISETVN